MSISDLQIVAEAFIRPVTGVNWILKIYTLLLKISSYYQFIVAGYDGSKYFSRNTFIMSVDTR